MKTSQISHALSLRKHFYRILDFRAILTPIMIKSYAYQAKDGSSESWQMLYVFGVRLAMWQKGLD